MGGGFFMLLGIFYGNPGWFRLGVTFELGEDIMHYIQMALASTLGIGPAMGWVKTRWVALGVHHLFGVIAGIPGYFLLSEDYECQYICMMLLSGVTFWFFLVGLLYMIDQSKPGINIYFALVVDCILTAVSIYIRIPVFLRACMILLPWVFANYSLIVSVPCSIAALCLLPF